jgi:hypothetical protein
VSSDVFSKTTLLADAGFCSEKNIKYLHDQRIEAYVADAMFRKRDPRFRDAQQHEPTRACEPFAKPKRELKFQPKDFQLAKDQTHCLPLRTFVEEIAPPSAKSRMNHHSNQTIAAMQSIHRDEIADRATRRDRHRLFLQSR